MSATDQKETWTPVVGRVLATWDVSHASLEGAIADLVARAVKEEREACAKIADDCFSGEMAAKLIRERTQR